MFLFNASVNFSLSVTKDMHVMDTEKIRQCGIANQALLFSVDKGRFHYIRSGSW